MELKRGSSLLILSLILLSTNIVLAETCSGDNLLFSLNAQTNAHVETYDQTNYVRDICYQTVMGVSPPSGASRTCTGSNAILSLSSLTNAHAEDPSLGNYATDICYQGLTCEIVSDPTASSGCTLSDSSTGKLVARISSLTNAHVEEATAGGNYQYEVCCRLSTSLVWKDSSNNILGPGSPIYVGDTIKAVATATTDTGQLFTIKEDDTGSDDTLVSGATGSVSGSDLVYSLTITGDSNDGPTAGTIDAMLDESSDPPTPGAFELFFSVSGLGLESYKLLNIGYCGDKIVQSSKEECDDGYDDASPNNGDVCTSTFESGCTYCDASCGTVVLPILTHGDGIISSPENCDCGDVALGTEHTNSAHPEGECSLGIGNQNTCTDDGDGSCAYCDDSTGQLVVLNFADMIWANLIGGKITTAEIGDTVMLKYPDGVSQTSSRDFLIFEDDTVFSNTYIAEILGVGDDLILNPLTGYSVDSNDDGVEDNILGIWTIEDSQVDSSVTSDFGDFKFQISTSSGTKAIKDSDKLEITNPIDNPSGGDGDDDTELVLIGPICGSDLKANTPNTEIEFSLTDLDDLVSYTITINGVETITSEQIEGSIWVPGSTSFKVPYTFSQVGVTSIRIDGESKRGDFLTVFSNVIVREETPGADEITFIASCIDSPTHYANIATDYADFEARVIAKRESADIDFDSSEAEISQSDVLYKWSYSDGMSFEATGDELIATEHTKYFLTKGVGNWATLEAELI